MKAEILESCTSRIYQIDGIEISCISNNKMKEYLQLIFSDILQNNSYGEIFTELVENFGEVKFTEECELCGSQYDLIYNINNKTNENK